MTTRPASISEEELLQRFTYHAPKDHKQLAKYIRLRQMALDFAKMLLADVPPGPELDRAIVKVEEALMTANSGIARRSGR